jgi:formamidopyrimidine-DNA glycosylase
LPELPEVETVRCGLEPVLVSRRVLRLEQRRPDLRFPFPEKFAERLHGRRVETLMRRAKYLVAHIEGGESLIMHLGMSGRFTIGQADGGAQTPGAYSREVGADPKHDHVVFHLEGGASVTYSDPRRFGFMLMTPTELIDSHPLIRGLGPEPLGNGLNAAYLAERAGGRRADLKAFLMDQRNVAGLGNIYVCEALYRARLSPKRSAACLTRKSGTPTERAERLVSAIRSVLRDAIAAGGSTLRDYRHADGALGYFQHTFSVYDRAGESCADPECRGTVHRIVQTGRSTFYCPCCQR